MEEKKKKLYSIGEVSKIMGVSVQTLRYYSSIGLVSPKYTNPSTGYRYYTVDQFHFVDRIKYLQKFRLSLDEIAEIIMANDIDLLVRKLEQKENEAREEIKHLEDVVDSIEWYKNYFTSADGTTDETGYSLHLPKRYMVAVAVIEGEPKADFHIRLNRMKHSLQLRDLNYMRQFSYLLDYGSLLESKLNPSHLGMYIKDAPPPGTENVLEIPEGDYFCFRARILSDGWSPYAARLFFDEWGKEPSIVLANEYEDNLYEYSRCVYEVQILIP